MRKTAFILLFIRTMVTSAHAQNKDSFPMSDGAFSKMMLDTYNFTIIGSQTPATGFKVETIKPSIALKGSVPLKSRSLLANLELEGGVSNDFMQLVSGKEVDGYFKANAGINILSPNNTAWRKKISRTENSLYERAIYSNEIFISNQIDTFSVIKTIFDAPTFHHYTFEELRNAVIANAAEIRDEVEGYSPNYMPSIYAYFEKLIDSVLVGYGAKSNDTATIFENFQASVFADRNVTIKAKKLSDDYDRLSGYLLEKDDQFIKNKQYDFEIELMKQLYTKKEIKWINVTFSGGNSAFRIYDEKTKIISKNHSSLYGVTISGNYLFKGVETSDFFYGRLGVTIQRANNLSDLVKFDYSQDSVIKIGVTESLKSVQSGIAYSGDVIHKTEFDIFSELYYNPWKKNFMSGVYAKLTYRQSAAWINKNKVALDLGLLWNVANSDKDAKNLLTIIPYISWSNLFKEYKDAGKLEEKKRSDLFIAGVKFGIPINIGK